MTMVLLSITVRSLLLGRGRGSTASLYGCRLPPTRVTSGRPAALIGCEKRPGEEVSGREPATEKGSLANSTVFNGCDRGFGHGLLDGDGQMDDHRQAEQAARRLL